MTRFRMPPGWVDKMKDSDSDPTVRPERPDWLKPGRDMTGQPDSVKRSYDYWSQIWYATPPWMTADMWADPKREHLDHIVPLKSKYVCGLNVPWNLEVVPIRDNYAKSNRYRPDCPNHLCPEKNLPVDMFGGYLDLELCNLNKQLELTF